MNKLVVHPFHYHPVRCNNRSEKEGRQRTLMGAATFSTERLVRDTDNLILHIEYQQLHLKKETAVVIDGKRCTQLKPTLRTTVEQIPLQETGNKRIKVKIKKGHILKYRYPPQKSEL